MKLLSVVRHLYVYRYEIPIVTDTDNSKEEEEEGEKEGDNINLLCSSSAMSGISQPQPQQQQQQQSQQPLHVLRRKLKVLRRNRSKSDTSITLSSKLTGVDGQYSWRCAVLLLLDECVVLPCTTVTGYLQKLVERKDGSTSSSTRSTDTNTNTTTVTHTTNNESSISSDYYSRCVWDMEDSPTSTTSSSCRGNSFSRLATSEVISKLQELDADLERIGTCSPPPSHHHHHHPRTDTDTGIDRSPQSMDNRIIERVDQNEYYPLCLIGRGCYSDVYMVTHVTTTTTTNHNTDVDTDTDDHNKEHEESRSTSSAHVAFKSLNATRIPNSSAFLIAANDLAMEAKVLSALHHENIIQLQGVSSTLFSQSYTTNTTNEGYFLLLELLTTVLSEQLVHWRKQDALSSTRELVKSSSAKIYEQHKHKKWSSMIKKPQLPTKKQLVVVVDRKQMYDRMERVALGIVQGMIYLHHTQGIIVRDLKPQNVGFTKEGTVRLFDFGMARKVEDCHDDEICGSPRYMAPEVMTGEGYSFQSDVYFFGILLYELCSLTIPFEKELKKVASLEEFHRLLVQEDNSSRTGGPMRPKLTRIACPRTRSLIEDCWQTDPTRRPSFEEIYRRILEVLVEASNNSGTTTLPTIFGPPSA